MKPVTTTSTIGASMVALLFGGERGLKPSLGVRATHSGGVALLFGGERGLKPRFARYARSLWVALLFGGERGLKLRWVSPPPGVAGRSPFRRGAWIETRQTKRASRAVTVALLFGGERGLKRWCCALSLRRLDVALLFGGERGLKPFFLSFVTTAKRSLSFSEGSVD